jgi:hypothetical protein
MDLSNDELAQLWYSKETESEICARLGIEHDQLVSAWRRAGLIVPVKNSRAENHYDGRPAVGEHGDDPLLAALKAAHPDKKPSR